MRGGGGVGGEGCRGLINFCQTFCLQKSQKVPVGVSEVGLEEGTTIHQYSSCYMYVTYILLVLY